MNKGPKNVTMLDVLDAIHDPDGRDLFNSIATDRGSKGILDYTIKITRKQYYSRLFKLVKADMIKRKGVKYVLTPFGEVIYSVQLGFDEAVDEHLKSRVEIPIIINQPLVEPSPLILLRRTIGLPELPCKVC
jgi:hypothetical protein